MTLRAVSQTVGGGASAPSIASGFNNSIRTVTSTTTAISTDYTLLGDATSASFNVTLPTPGSSTGQVLNVKKIDASVNTVTLVGTIDGTANKSLTTQNQTVTVQSNGTSWYII